ncbi:MAG: hypothetical protein OJF51_004074 [Nitrospira sp.]|jgi:hypothetical protein|nr:MAG: hypothetical protein OJF51_004074 [Nitrospira sp.]
MLKKAASVVLAGHCRLTISAAFTNVPCLIRHGVNLRGSTYHRARAAQAARGWVGGKVYASPVRHWALTDSRPSANVTLIILRVADLAAALLDGLFEHPEIILTLASHRKFRSYYWHQPSFSAAF